MNVDGHGPRQPHWTCVRCGQDWPCPSWRAEIGRARRSGRLTLMIYLARIMLTAQRDLPHLTSPELVARFLEWVRVPPPPAELPDRRPWWVTDRGGDS
jgi:hypothetical protein